MCSLQKRKILYLQVAPYHLICSHTRQEWKAQADAPVQKVKGRGVNGEGYNTHVVNICTICVKYYDTVMCVAFWHIYFCSVQCEQQKIGTGFSHIQWIFILNRLSCQSVKRIIVGKCGQKFSAITLLPQWVMAPFSESLAVAFVLLSPHISWWRPTHAVPGAVLFFPITLSLSCLLLVRSLRFLVCTSEYSETIK